jgi:hypothetical protein
MAYLFVVLGGAALGVAAVALRRSSLARLRVPPRAALALTGAAVGLGVGCVFLLDPALTPVHRGGPSEGPRPQGPPGSRAKALAPGSEAPPLKAAGWLNGPPPRPASGGPRLIVLDIWAHW